MNTEPQLIDPFLTDFVQRYSYRKQGAARARIRYLDRLLRWFVEETSRTLSCKHCQSCSMPNACSIRWAPTRG